MKFSSAALVAAASTTVLAAPATPAAPAEKRAALNDGIILNYALSLEHLEDTFYRQGLANFTQAQFASAGFGTTFYNNLKEIAADEATHVGFLTTALSAAGATPAAECTYNFPYKTPKDFIALASVLEGVGVSAYLGAAASISNKGYLTAAGSILTVEARHSSYIRQATGLVPFAYPFDTPLDFSQVYTLAAAFITGCPTNNVTTTLPFKAFPSLSVLNAPSPLVSGSMINLITAAGTVLPKKTYAAWASITGPIFTPVTLSSNGQSAWTSVPDGVAGQSYVVLTRSPTKVNDANILAGPAILEVVKA